MATTKNNKTINPRMGYGVNGVEINLDMMELFQLSLKADMLGQTIAWLRDQEEVHPNAVTELEDLENFLDRILKTGGFKKVGKADIFKPATEEEDE